MLNDIEMPRPVLDPRFDALAKLLDDMGYLGGVVIDSFDYAKGEAPPVSIAYSASAPADKLATAMAIVARWPWGENGRDVLEDETAKAAAKAVLGQSSPVIDMVRVFGRHIWDRLNEIAVHVGLPKKLEPTIFAELDAYVDAGLSLPGIRPDLETPPDGE